MIRRAALAALLCVGAAAPSTPLPLLVGGRVAAAPAGAVDLGWPGGYVEARFRGRGVRVRFEATTDFLRLLVDGEERAQFRRPGRVDLALGNLPVGEHRVRLEKLTESQQGATRIFGMLPLAGTTPLPPALRPRAIEFIGDSYTVGYGDVSPTKDCTAAEVHDRTDTQAAFGPLVARRLNAEYRVVAYSGYGVVRNYAGHEPGASLPANYSRARPDGLAAAAPEPEPGWRPQTIVVNLGTNDFSTPVGAGERWRDRDALARSYRDAYAAFVRQLATAQPQARFVLMGSDLFFPEVERVAATLAPALPGRIRTLRFAGLDYGGCHAHPSLADHRKLADQLAPLLAGGR